jgi:hypothetical protein
MNTLTQIAIECGGEIEEYTGNDNQKHEQICFENERELQAFVDAVNVRDSEPVTPDFFQLENGSDYWYERPDDDSIIGDLIDVQIGTEYEVLASHTYRQTYRITKVPDETDDDTLVELVKSDRSYFTTPQPEQSANIKRLNTMIKTQALLFDAREARLEDDIRTLRNQLAERDALIAKKDEALESLKPLARYGIVGSKDIEQAKMQKLVDEALTLKPKESIDE